MSVILIREPLNKGRQIELDIARGLSVLFMIAVHSLENFADEAAQESFLGQIIDFFGGVPSAPVFMFLLGVGVVYTSKSSPLLFVKRGMLLIFSGYVLNLLRGTLPNLFTYYVTTESDYLQIALAEFLAIDILQFAGLALITFGVVKKIQPRWYLIVCSILIIALLNFKLLPFTTPNPYLQAVSGLFWGSGELSYFPYLTWIVYPLAGYLFGTVLIRCADKTRFYAITLMVSTLLLVLFYSVFVIYLKQGIGLNDSYAYYHHNLFGNLVNLSFVTGWISLIFFASTSIPKALNKIVVRWSNNVTDIFNVHWVLIGWLLLLTDSNSLERPYYLVLLVILTVISDSLATHYAEYKKSKKQK